ncbi:MAG TPA: cytidine deaminase [Clostridiales bacterium]|nr:MAG: cytidine deaminase [Clostridiales bacterium GWD2_32_59]HAN10146.1 cytidine deaminase [Clostridiales bacterium]
MNDQIRRKLIDIAKEEMQKAYAPVTKLKVGSAILTENGEIYKGCNIESKSFGSLVCAERDAIFEAITDGNHDFVAVAVVSSLGDETFPCGICRQVMYEFMSENVEIILEDKDGNIKVYTLKELFPHGYKL